MGTLYSLNSKLQQSMITKINTESEDALKPFEYDNDYLYINRSIYLIFVFPKIPLKKQHFNLKTIIKELLNVSQNLAHIILL